MAMFSSFYQILFIFTIKLYWLNFFMKSFKILYIFRKKMTSCCNNIKHKILQNLKGQVAIGNDFWQFPKWAGHSRETKDILVHT